MLDLAIVDAVPGAVVSVGTAAVVASVQVEAHRVVGAGVPPRLAFVNICRRTQKNPKKQKRTSHICLLELLSSRWEWGGVFSLQPHEEKLQMRL